MNPSIKKFLHDFFVSILRIPSYSLLSHGYFDFLDSPQIFLSFSPILSRKTIESCMWVGVAQQFFTPCSDGISRLQQRKFTSKRNEAVPDPNGKANLICIATLFIGILIRFLNSSFYGVEDEERRKKKWEKSLRVFGGLVGSSTLLESIFPPFSRSAQLSELQLQLQEYTVSFKVFSI